MVIAMRIDLFADPAQFRKEMDAYARAVRTLTPIPGATEAICRAGPRQRLRWTTGPTGSRSEEIISSCSSGRRPARGARPVER